MTLEEFAQLLKRRWRLVAAVMVVLVLAGIALGFSGTRTHQVTARLVVTPVSQAESSQGLGPVILNQTGMRTYAELAVSRDVAATVVRKLGLSDSPAELAERMVAVVPTDTFLIDLTVSAGDADQAVAIANAAAREATEVVNRLFQDRGAGLSLTVASPADPSGVTAPGILRFAPFGLVVGLLAGIALAIIREILNQRVRDDDDVRKSLGVEPLAQIALGPAGGTLPILDFTGRDTESVEAVRRLRTTLQMRPHPPRTVLIAGPSGGEGSSTVALLLAQVSADSGAKTMLVECDLRNPRLGAQLGLPSHPGLADFLRGTASFGEVVIDASSRTVKPTPRSRLGAAEAQTNVLGVVPAGSRSHQPAELLSRNRFREFLDAVAPFYDTVIFDGAAVLPFADSVAVSTCVDATLLTVATGRTPRGDIERAMVQLSAVGTEVTGVVLVTRGQKAGLRTMVAGGGVR